ncbi:MAG: metal ABC transporter substrate-binding protein [Acutalibacteraceae bacterium]|nr:metal ABC transporter substrate-binding protein [Acutalibacteraceae bacterium]
MKRIVLILTAVLMLVCSFSGCSGKDGDSDKLKIVATVFPPYDFAHVIAGDRAEVSMIIRPGSESHTFEPTPNDMKKAEESDIFIAFGGESESWAQRLINASENKDRLSVTLNDCVALLEASSGQEHHHHSDEHSHTHEHDEHIWTSPKNAVKISEAIYKAICEKDPENKDYYTENYNSLIDKLNKLDASYKEVTLNSNKTLVFGDRFPFLYLAKEYSLNYRAAFSGCAEQTQPNVNTLIELIEFIKEENIETVFYTEFSSQKIADTLCSETGAEKQLLHSCHNVTKSEWENGETYITLMEKNLNALKIALK